MKELDCLSSNSVRDDLTRYFSINKTRRPCGDVAFCTSLSEDSDMVIVKVRNVENGGEAQLSQRELGVFSLLSGAAGDKAKFERRLINFTLSLPGHGFPPRRRPRGRLHSG